MKTRLLTFVGLLLTQCTVLLGMRDHLRQIGIAEPKIKALESTGMTEDGWERLADLGLMDEQLKEFVVQARVRGRPLEVLQALENKYAAQAAPEEGVQQDAARSAAARLVREQAEAARVAAAEQARRDELAAQAAAASVAAAQLEQERQAQARRDAAVRAAQAARLAQSASSAPSTSSAAPAPQAPAAAASAAAAAKKEEQGETKESKEEKAALEKLSSEMAQLVASQQAAQADVVNAQSILNTVTDETQKESVRIEWVRPAQEQLATVAKQIKAKQEAIDKLMGKTSSAVASQSMEAPKTKEDLAMEKAVAESLADVKKREEVEAASQQALARVAAASKGVETRSVLVRTLPLVNVGSTCFANATLQCLFQLPAVQRLVLGLGDSATWKAAHPRLTQQSIDFIAQYQHMVVALQAWTSTEAFAPTAFCTAMRTRVFGGEGGMQDALQFFAAFAEDVRELCYKTPFDTRVVSTVTCGSCGGVVENTENQTFLALPIAGGTLDVCLKQYQAAEPLARYRCRSCGRQDTSARALKVTSLPTVLVLQLKRYSGTTAITKITTPVSFPLVLNQANFYQGDEKAAGVAYDLVGMVNHNGSFAGGHYTAYVKNSGDSTWRFCDDATIAARTQDQVKVVADAGVDTGYSSATPYLLFYLRRGASTPSSVSSSSAS
jgi:ubiquitin C-terminal hydrolase